MKTIQFKITLLSDVILSQTSKTTGNKKTLDFIPGNVFLGIVAKKYNDFGNDQLTVFHSPKVRYGDAHPLVNGIRALRKPAVFLKPKHADDNNLIYIHHQIKDHNKVSHLQLEQQRTDFFAFSKTEAVEYKADYNFAIKSAYDRKKRRSMDEQMYGYQSLEEGSEYCFELNVDNDVKEEIINKIKSCLKGNHTVGRSRTAQYGLVKIEEDSSFTTIKSNDEAVDNKYVIYAESRLILQDKYGNPTFIPQPEHFGIEGGTYCPELSQIRTFAYSPFNFHRATFDNERKGIEKGSVIVIKGGEVKKQTKFVGIYQNEGFGKVIFNPHFFKTDESGRSTLEFKLSKPEKNNKPRIDTNDKALSKTDQYLFSYLQQKQQQEEDEKEVYRRVNEFVNKNSGLFKEDLFASQWGTIRSLAMQYPTYAQLKEELFTKEIRRNNKLEPNAYLTHGVAKAKWDDYGRRRTLEKFFSDTKEHMIQFAIINLASEMAKKTEGK